MRVLENGLSLLPSGVDTLERLDYAKTVSLCLELQEREQVLTSAFDLKK